MSFFREMLSRFARRRIRKGSGDVTFGLLFILRVVRTQAISFLKLFSVRVGLDTKRLWILNENSYLYGIKIDLMTTLKFRVLLCRIRPFSDIDVKNEMA